ncbi:MAG: hypothetical protein AAF652_09555 [Cyanobacteria bacterium P01_C01_bin.72]
MSPVFSQIYDHYHQQYPPLNEIGKSPHLRETFIGRGKSIIVETIIKNDLRNLLEIGSFLGSSIDFWFNSCPKIQIVAVDPLKGGWAGNHLQKLRYNDSCLLSLDEPEIAYLNSEQGLYQTFLRNMLMYKNRLVLLRKESETAIAELKSFEYKPDIIFLDADKKYSTLEFLYNSFPESILCGDDYRYKDFNHDIIMRDNVSKLANMYDRSVRFYLDTWVIE